MHPLHTSSSSSGSHPTPEHDVCPVCRGIGRLRRDVPVGHPDFGKDVACTCRTNAQDRRHQQRLLTLCEQWGLQRSQVLATFRPQVKGVQAAFQTVRTLSEQFEAWGRHNAIIPSGPPPSLPQEWLVLCGPTGTGKTHLAMALANAGIDAGLLTLFASLPDLLDALRATVHAESQHQDEHLLQLPEEVELLVLDDVGTHRSTSWADEKLYQLLNFRYNYRLPTVLTLDQHAWTVLDERIRSRCQDASLVRHAHLEDAQDYRMMQGDHAMLYGESHDQQEDTEQDHPWETEQHADYTT